MLDHVIEDIDSSQSSKKIQQLKSWLAQHDFDANQFKQFITNLNLSHPDFQAYSHFNPDRYTRNVIAKSEYVEMLLICWEVGQMSPVHNHDFSKCFVHCLEGKVIENSYRYQHNDMQFNATKTLVSGESMFINDFNIYHEFGNASDVDRAVTLHFYLPKIKRYNLFDKTTRLISTTDF